MTNINKQDVLNYYAFFTHNPANNQVVFHSTNLPPIYRGKMHRNGYSASGNDYIDMNFGTYDSNIYASLYDTLSAVSLTGSEVNAVAIRNAVHVWSLETTRIRRVRTGTKAYLQKLDRHTIPGAPFDGTKQDRTDISKVNASYRPFDPRNSIGAPGNVTVSWTNLQNYMTAVAGITNPSYSAANAYDLRACHNSCHSACHGSRGRR